jgi:O-antigen/teichoic acid export membrane protein
VLVEVRLVTMRMWGWVIGRVAMVGLLRLPLFLFPALTRNPVGLLLILAGPPALSGLVGALALRYAHPASDRGSLFPVPPEAVPVLRYASVNYVAMLAAQAPQFVFPLLVRYDKDTYGAFWVAWTVTTVVFLVPHVISQTVLAEGSRAHTNPERQARLGLMVALALMTAMTVGAFLMAGVVVSTLFGSKYQTAAEILPRMVAAGIPWAVTAVLLARARVYSQHLVTVVITGGFALATLVPAAVTVGSSGITGAATAWFVGNVIAAGIAVAATAIAGHPEQVDDPTAAAELAVTS